MSKRLTRAIVVLALLSLAVGVAVASAASSRREFDARLNGHNDRTTSHGRGSATFHISSTGRSIRYTLRASGLTGSVQAAHIHFGTPSTKSGPVLIAICPGPCKLPKSGTLTASRFNKQNGKVSSFAAAIRAIRAGHTYVNIHTKKFPAGEIRGQLRRHT